MLALRYKCATADSTYTFFPPCGVDKSVQRIAAHRLPCTRYMFVPLWGAEPRSILCPIRAAHLRRSIFWVNVKPTQLLCRVQSNAAVAYGSLYV